MEKKVSNVKDLKDGSYIFVEDTPCKVVSITHSKPGKHGSAKARIDAMGLVDGRRRSIILSADSRIDVPIIEKRDAQVVSISGGKASCMDLQSYEIFEVDIPEEFRGKLSEGMQISYWDVGFKMIKGIK